MKTIFNIRTAIQKRQIMNHFKLFIGMVLCGLNLVLAAGPNLLTNGSFENGLADWRIDKVGNPEASAVIDRENAVEGRLSLNLKFRGELKKNVYLTVWRTLKVQPSTTYRISFRARMQNSKPFWAGIEYQPLVRPENDSPDWREYSFEFTTKANSSVRFRFLVESPAENIWLDDVRLEKVLNSSPSVFPAQSILAFGARPDGRGDSTDAFRKAVAAGVTQILLPEGEFAVKELVLPDNIGIRGCGERSRIVPFSADQKFVIRGGSNSKFSDFSVDAGKQKTHGLYFLRAENVVIDRISVSDSKAFGINFDHVNHAVIGNCTIRSTHTGIMQTYCSNIRTVQNTVLDSTKHGIQFWSQDKWQPQFRTRNLWFCNNYVRNAVSGEGGIWGVGVIGVVMSGNIVECAKDVGLDLEWCEDSVISGNVVRDTEHGGISLFFSCRNITITGNTVYNNRVYEKEPGAYWVRAGIWLTYRNVKTFRNDMGHENITISGNTVVNGPGKRRAVWVGYGKNVLVQGNNLNGAAVHHGGRHGDLGIPVKEYDGNKDYRIGPDGVISER